MATFIYRCPVTGLNVQGWTSDEKAKADTRTYETVTCTVCRRIHLVNSETGKTLVDGE